VSYKILKNRLTDLQACIQNRLQAAGIQDPKKKLSEVESSLQSGFDQKCLAALFAACGLQAQIEAINSILISLNRHQTTQTWDLDSTSFYEPIVSFAETNAHKEIAKFEEAHKACIDASNP
jgi:hypothetical protein